MPPHTLFCSGNKCDSRVRCTRGSRIKGNVINTVVVFSCHIIMCVITHTVPRLFLFPFLYAMIRETSGSKQNQRQIITVKCKTCNAHKGGFNKMVTNVERNMLSFDRRKDSRSTGWMFLPLCQPVMRSHSHTHTVHPWTSDWLSVSV